MPGRHKQHTRLYLSPGRTQVTVPQNHPPKLLRRQHHPPPPPHSRPMPNKVSSPPLHSIKVDVFVDLTHTLSLRLCIAIDVKIPLLLLLLRPLKHLNYNHRRPRMMLPNLHRLPLHPHPTLKRPLLKPLQNLNRHQRHQLRILHPHPKPQRHLHSPPLKLSLQHQKHHPVLHRSHNPPRLLRRHRRLSLPQLAQVKVPVPHRLLVPVKVRVQVQQKVRVLASKQAVRARRPFTLPRSLSLVKLLNQAPHKPPGESHIIFTDNVADVLAAQPHQRQKSQRWSSAAPLLHLLLLNSHPQTNHLELVPCKLFLIYVTPS